MIASRFIAATAAAGALLMLPQMASRPGWPRLFPAFDRGDIQAIYARSRTLDEEIAAMRQFVGFLNSVEDALCQERLSLADASDSIIVSARENRPRYLRFVDIVEEGQTLREKVARNLAGRLEEHVKLGFHPAQIRDLARKLLKGFQEQSRQGNGPP
jgi:hypothetical protein